MARTLFGTDGIRGTANRYPMTAETALRVGQAAGVHFVRGNHRHRVVIGKDTRLSGYLLEPALTAGFVAAGMDPLLVGPMPTPAIAFLTRTMRADLGVMISASHNPFEDNGIKLFGPDGFKLSDEIEAEIEARMGGDLLSLLAAPPDLGRAKRYDDAQGRYIEFVKKTFPNGSLSSLRIVVDCAHGAAYKVAPTVLWELGAEVFAIGSEPDGFNINRGCGSTHPEAIQARVLKEGAHIGIALDGDADRVVIADELGNLVDGDQVMAAIATDWSESHRLRGGLVATVMSNLGFQRYVTQVLKMPFERTQVGDRYVSERMRELDCNLGGEQSGHIIMSDYNTTGDGLVAALQVLAIMKKTGRAASAACRLFEPYPQRLVNVPYCGADPLELEAVQNAIRAAEASLKGHGRLLVRKSGTEPLIRVMAEAEDPGEVAVTVDSVVGAIRHSRALN